MRLYTMGAVRLVLPAGLRTSELVTWFQRARRMRLALVRNDNGAAPLPDEVTPATAIAEGSCTTT